MIADELEHLWLIAAAVGQAADQVDMLHRKASGMLNDQFVDTLREVRDNLSQAGKQLMTTGGSISHQLFLDAQASSQTILEAAMAGIELAERGKSK